MDMTVRKRAVAVKQLPAAFNAKQRQVFLREFDDCLNIARPCIVLDCSAAGEFEGSSIRLMLSCLEEAMKRNGDVRLAAVAPEAMAVLARTGVDRLFKIFPTCAGAVESFHRPSAVPAAGADEGRPCSAEDAA
jgi:anti-anti-sigma regulatory factor